MSKTGLLLLLAVLPVIAILFYVYKKDKTKEPMWLLLSFFSKGILSCFLVFTISDVLSAFLPFMNKETEEMLFVEVAIYSFFCVALVEEFCKWLMVYRGGYHHKEFDEIYDILVYSIFVSLGFAFFENIMYVLTSQSIYIALLRAVSAIPGHACDAVFMGYYLSLAKQCRILNKPNKEKEYIRMSIFIPTILHGIYDFCLFINKDEFNFLWVVDFPLLEKDEELGRFFAMHHPFTMPMEEDLELLDTDMGKARAKAYDIVLNGVELGGGSVRIHQDDVQEKMFELLGFTQEEAHDRFGFLLDAFKYGVPPHAGLAFGLDRMIMLMTGADSIRDVIAFPKIKDASCLMSNAPDVVDPKQLEELCLKVEIPEAEK